MAAGSVSVPSYFFLLLSYLSFIESISILLSSRLNFYYARFYVELRWFRRTLNRTEMGKGIKIR